MEQKYCQSCGMPMEDSLYGIEKDGTKSDDYCSYCYKDGEFGNPNETMEDMIETCIPFMKESGMDEKQARKILNNQLPQLKRWKK